MALIPAATVVNLLRLPPLPSLKDILKIYKLKAVKQLSQNFILDYKISHKIVNTAGDIRGCHVLEVGPGPGGITRAILEKRAANVTVIEKDSRFKPCLDMLSDAVPNKMNIIYGDILSIPLENMFPRELARPWDDRPPSIHVIGNLPFNISTPLVIKLLKSMSERSGIFTYGRVRLTFTFQEEVAQRMAAHVVSPQRCRLSTICQYLAHVKFKDTISGTACVPSPKVDIGIVRLTPLKEPKINQPFHLVEKVMRHTFHYRQQYIKNSVATLFPKELSHLTLEMLLKADVDPKARSFELSVEEFGRMCDEYRMLCDLHPGLIDYDYRSHDEVMKVKMKLKEKAASKTQ